MAQQTRRDFLRNTLLAGAGEDEAEAQRRASRSPGRAGGIAGDRYRDSNPPVPCFGAEGLGTSAGETRGFLSAALQHADALRLRTKCLGFEPATAKEMTT